MKKPNRRPRPSPSPSSDTRLDLLDAMSASCQHLLTVAQLLAAAAHTGEVGPDLAARTAKLLYQEGVSPQY